MVRGIGRRWCLRAIGYGWFVGWGVLLWAVHAPWEGLGGLVGERARWLERFVLATAWIVGATAGELTRGWRHGRGRWLIYPVGIAGTAALWAFARAGQGEAIGIVLNGLVAYVSGALTTWMGVSEWCRGGPPDQDLEEPRGRSSADGPSDLA
jgi:hypothetical protein